MKKQSSHMDSLSHGVATDEATASSAGGSPAFDAVVSAVHPSDADGGPCATCAFRLGTEANRSEHTNLLARLCVEGITPFDCHEHTRLCRGWIAAVNLIAAEGLDTSEDARRHREAMAFAADMLGRCIDRAVAADVAHAREKGSGQ